MERPIGRGDLEAQHHGVLVDDLEAGRLGVDGIQRLATVIQPNRPTATTATDAAMPIVHRRRLEAERPRP